MIRFAFHIDTTSKLWAQRMHSKFLRWCKYIGMPPVGFHMHNDEFTLKIKQLNVAIRTYYKVLLCKYFVSGRKANRKSWLIELRASLYFRFTAGLPNTSDLNSKYTHLNWGKSAIFNPDNSLHHSYKTLRESALYITQIFIYIYLSAFYIRI